MEKKISKNMVATKKKRTKKTRIDEVVTRKECSFLEHCSVVFIAIEQLRDDARKNGKSIQRHNIIINAFVKSTNFLTNNNRSALKTAASEDLRTDLKTAYRNLYSRVDSEIYKRKRQGNSALRFSILRTSIKRQYSIFFNEDIKTI